MSSLPKTYKAFALTGTHKPLELQERELVLPKASQILIKVLACGVCYSDHGIQEGHLGEPFPIVPGHEIVGDVVAVGEGVSQYKIGDRVGGGWHGGHDFTCRSCQRGQFQTCTHKAVNGYTNDGGYAEYCLLRTESVVPIPADLDPAEAAPLLCAGLTVFNGMRKLQIPAGEVVAVQGLGGLGHLAVQFARAMGYRVVALSRGDDKRALAMQLGASAYIDGRVEDVAARLQEMGGVAMIVATAPGADALSGVLNGLQPFGKLLVLAPLGPVALDTTTMVVQGISVHGWPSGHALDSVDTVRFAQATGVKCMVEKRPFLEADRALREVAEGKPRFRNVLVME